MKKFSIILVVLLCMTIFTVTGFAAEPSQHAEFIITPRYVVIYDVASTANITSTSAKSDVVVSLSGSYKTTIKIVLEVSKDGGKTYTTDSTLANKTVTSSLPSASGSKSGLNSSYTYRTKTTISVFNSSGAEIDGDSFYSY